jgi:pimeloyl-ACP methyl ester carboxylesterase
LILSVTAALGPARVVGAEVGPASRGARILVVRGIFNVFSLGLDDLACKLAQRGYHVDVAPPSLALVAAAAIERECRADATRKPLIIIGHSLGGRFCCSIPWQWRDSGLAVRLIVVLDANPQTPVPDNVQRCVNLYTTNDLGVFHGQDVRVVDPRTELVNLDMTRVRRPPGVPPVDHFTIDDSVWIHSLVIEEVDHAVGRGAGAAARPGLVPGNRPRYWNERAGESDPITGRVLNVSPPVSRPVLATE